jgi:hypothetical protein
MNRRLAFAALSLLGLAACTPETRTVVVPVAPATAAGCDTRFQVANASSLTVRSVYFSPSSQRSFGVDQLGANVLPPGRLVTYRAANASRYDFRVVWTNGRLADLYGVNICALNRITVTNGGLRAS